MYVLDAKQKYHTDLQEYMHSLCEPIATGYMWKALLPWKSKKTVMVIRYGTLWTACMALRNRCPYATAVGPILDGSCPLCNSLHDSPGHILGSCPELSNCHISRHNKSLCLIQDYILDNSLGQYYTILDATSRSALPPGVADTRLPSMDVPWPPLRHDCPFQT